MIELKSNDFDYDSICVQLGARNFNQLYFDRKDDDMNRSSELLTMDENEILNHMRRKRTKYLAIKSQSIKDKLNELPYMHKMKNLGEWVIYCVDFTKHNSTCSEQ